MPRLGVRIVVQFNRWTRKKLFFWMVEYSYAAAGVIISRLAQSKSAWDEVP